MQFYKKSHGEKWHKITESEMTKVINAYFGTEPKTSWDGRTIPSRSQVWDHLNSGKTLTLYIGSYTTNPTK